MIKVKLNFNTQALKVDGTPFKDTIAKNGHPIELDDDLLLNKLIGSNLSLQIEREEKADAYKIGDWAESLYKGDVLELDMTDTNRLEDIILKKLSFYRCINKQICEIIDKAREAAKSNN